MVGIIDYLAYNHPVGNFYLYSGWHCPAYRLVDNVAIWQEKENSLVVIVVAAFRYKPILIQ